MSTVTESGGRFRPASARGFRKPAKGRPVWEERPHWYGQFGKGTVITAVLLVILVPVWGVVLTSFSTKGAINSAGNGLVLIPHGLSLQNYQLIFSGGTVSRSLFVTAFITIVGTKVSCPSGKSLPEGGLADPQQSAEFSGCQRPERLIQ